MFLCEMISRQERDSIRILRCRSRDSLAVVPERVRELPVTEVAPYAFSAQRSGDSPEGPRTFWWDAEDETEQPGCGDLPLLAGSRLEELRLPESLEKVGAYAFYSCGNLRRLEAHGATMDWGAGVFTGCSGVKELILHVDEERGSCMREILAELRQTLDVWYRPERRTGERNAADWKGLSEGRKETGREELSRGRNEAAREGFSGGRNEASREELSGGQNKADREGLSEGRNETGRNRGAASGEGTLLVFPEYFEEAVENTPARILVTETHGCGQRYRNAFVRTQFQFKEYDGLFAHVQVQEPEELVIRLVLGRLMYPYRLEGVHQKVYMDYLALHGAAAAEQAVRQGAMDQLRWLFDHVSLDADSVERLLALANRCGDGAAVSFLMDRKRRSGMVTRRRFSLM